MGGSEAICLMRYSPRCPHLVQALYADNSYLEVHDHFVRLKALAHNGVTPEAVHREAVQQEFKSMY